MSSTGSEVTSTLGPEVDGATPDADADAASGATGPAPEEPSIHELYDVLANQRRRYALHYLRQADERVDFGEMAEQIAAWEYEKSVREVTSTERKYVYSALQQRHLPKMDEVGLVEFDKRAGRVSPTPALSEVDVYAEVVGDKNVPWGVYFPALSGIHALLLAFVGLDVAPFVAFTDFEWALLFVSSLLVSSLVFLYDTRRMKLGAAGPPPEVN
jgi:hypothetical protein